MKWVLSHASDDIHHWQLQKEDSFKLLTLNLQRLSLRLAGSSKRLFFLDVQGFLQKKILLRTEYGITIGETAFADKSSGQLLLNGRKFFYRQDKKQLLLFDSEKQLINKCELPENPPSKIEVYGLLFGLAWFSTADVAEEKEKTLSAIT